MISRETRFQIRRHRVLFCFPFLKIEAKVSQLCQVTQILCFAARLSACPSLSFWLCPVGLLHRGLERNCLRVVNDYVCTQLLAVTLLCNRNTKLRGMYCDISVISAALTNWLMSVFFVLFFKRLSTLFPISARSTRRARRAFYGRRRISRR